MKISVRWLNEYLEPGTVSAAEAEHALTFAGFPIESAEPLPEGRGGADTRLDVEVTSNRGDCLSHIGVAREVAAATGRRLRLPAPDRVFDWKAGAIAASVKPLPVQSRSAPSRRHSPTARTAAEAVALENRTPDVCRLFTARVIRAVRVGPSPGWLVEALASVGQRSINNVVDVTNFVAFEYGQPSHVFDLNTLAHDASGRARVVVRYAAKGETLKLLDGRTITFQGDELVVADEENGGRPVSLAGVMGGADTEVSGSTTDVLLEAATWDPVTIRRAARRFGIRTDASFRFERIVDPRTIDAAAQRAAALIAGIAGGELLVGAVAAGAPAEPPTVIRLRPARCRAMLGVDIPTPEIARRLAALGVGVEPEPAMAAVPPSGEPSLSGAAPAWRPDLTREIDLIEEVARTHGLDKLPIHEKVGVRVTPPQPSEVAARELARVLTGLGFYEATTFTFVSPKMAKPFVPHGLALLEVCDERRKADPVLRPSSLPSLLACRKANQDAGVRPDGGEGGAGFRLYETAAVFGQHPPKAKGERGREVESRNLSLLADASFPAGAKAAEQKQAAVRLMRGTIEAAARALGGSAVALEFEPATLPVPAYDPAAAAAVRLNGQVLGVMGLVAPAVLRDYDLATPVVAADLNLDALLALYPPKALVTALPEFPAIERDLSLVVAETVPWARLSALVDAANLALLEETAFIGTYRGQQVGPGRKSVTLRLRFRDPSRTLRHEEVDPQVTALVARAKSELGAELRA